MHENDGVDFSVKNPISCWFVRDGTCTREPHCLSIDYHGSRHLLLVQITVTQLNSQGTWTPRPVSVFINVQVDSMGTGEGVNTLTISYKVVKNGEESPHSSTHGRPWPCGMLRTEAAPSFGSQRLPHSGQCFRGDPFLVLPVAFLYSNPGLVGNLHIGGGAFILAAWDELHKLFRIEVPDHYRSIIVRVHYSLSTAIGHTKPALAVSNLLIMNHQL